jgi:hypothetical protein
MPVGVFKLRFVMPGDETAIHKIQNFGEELMRTMRDRNLGDVGNPDSAIDELSVNLHCRRHTGEVRKLMRKLLAKHYLDTVVTVTEL